MSDMEGPVPNKVDLSEEQLKEYVRPLIDQLQKEKPSTAVLPKNFTPEEIEAKKGQSLFNKLKQNEKIVYMADHETLIGEWELIQDKQSLLPRSMRESVEARIKFLIQTGQITL